MKDLLKKNTAIGLWMFIFAVAIGLNYLNNYVWVELGVDIVFNGGYVLSFFIFLAGYLLMNHFKKNEKKNSKELPSEKSWKYTFDRIKIMYPILFVGVLLAFVVRNIISGTKLSSIFYVFMDSIWEFLGLSQLGIVGMHELKTITVDNVIGFSTLWNTPLWILPAIIISGLILYYIVSKNEDFFKGIFAPLVIVVVYGVIGMSNIGLDNFSLNVLGLSNGLCRVFAGMCVGMLAYYVVTYFQKEKYSETMMLTASFLHIGLAIMFLYTIYAGIPWSELTNGLIVLLFLIILLINKDYIVVLYNKSSVCNFLGRLSIYYYATFITFIFLLAYIFPEMNYTTSIIFNILFSTCFAFIFMVLHELFNGAIQKNK